MLAHPSRVIPRARLGLAGASACFENPEAPKDGRYLMGQRRVAVWRLPVWRVEQVSRAGEIGAHAPILARSPCDAPAARECRVFVVVHADLVAGVHCEDAVDP